MNALAMRKSDITAEGSPGGMMQLVVKHLAIKHYRAEGPTLMAEPLVLLHGWGSDSRTWAPLLPYLRQYTHVITVDLPGFGDSDRIDDYSLKTVLELLMAHMPEHAAYMGWSLGGMLATALAAHAPKRVTRLITLASNLKFVAGDDWSTGMDESTYRTFLQGFSDNAMLTLKRFCGLMVQGDSDERGLLKKLRELNSRSSENCNSNWLRALNLLGDIDNREALAHLHQPALHLYAEGDALVPVSVQTAVKKTLNVSAHQQLQVFSGAAHAFHWSQPEKVSEAIKGFLSKEKYHLDKRKIAQSFSRAAATYDSVADLQRAVGEQLMNQLNDHLTTVDKEMDQAEMQILDLGCGTGCFSETLIEQFPEAGFLGLDIAEGMLCYARQKIEPQTPAANWLCGDAEALPLADDSVDIVFSSLAIQWCEDLPALFGELKRLLKPGGKIFFSTLGPGTLHELKAAWQTVDGYAHVNRFIAAETIETAITEAGLIVSSWQNQDRVLQYQQLRELTHELKALGAHNVNSGQSAGLTGRRRVQQFREAYEGFRVDGLLPATYEVYYGLLSH